MIIMGCVIAMNKWHKQQIFTKKIGRLYIFQNYKLRLGIKPNSHQTIFSTDSHRRPPILESVGVDIFFFFKSVGVTWKSVGVTPPIFLFKNRPIFSPISPPISPPKIIKHVW